MNTTIKTGLAAILLLAISCTKENTANHSATVTLSTNKALTFTIGQHYGGGIIFYIDSTGQHGLIADTVDLPLSAWWNGVNIVTGATKIKIGSGKANTRKIVLAQGKLGHYAAIRCSQHKGSGYTDWFLPSRDELIELYLHKDLVGGFSKTFYWSSSEQVNDSSQAFRLNFRNDYSDYTEKTNTHHVRAVRAF